MTSATPTWALVTGGTRGIGRGIVTCLLDAGYTVVFTYKSSSGEAAAIEAAAERAGHKARGFQCDGTDEAAVEALASQLIHDMGAPAALVNNAGITDDALLCHMPVQSWDRVIDTNLRPVFLFSKAVLPAMFEAGGGAIVNMSSVSAIRGNVGQTNYSATKAAILGMTQSLALEVARFGVRVNAVLPGLVKTEMIDAIPEAKLKSMQQRIPMRRLCDVAEVGKLVRYLVSDDAAYITGQAISIDGGLSA